jgi:hypothetical protein
MPTSASNRERQFVCFGSSRPTALSSPIAGDARDCTVGALKFATSQRMNGPNVDPSVAWKIAMGGSGGSSAGTPGSDRLAGNLPFAVTRQAASARSNVPASKRARQGS